MRVYEIWYDTSRPYYADHTAIVSADSKDDAVQKLREYKSAHGITIHVYHVHEGRLTL